MAFAPRSVTMMMLMAVMALVALSQAAAVPGANNAAANANPKNDLNTEASERLFDLGSWVNRYPSYNNYRPYYGGSGYYYNRPGSYYPTSGSYYPNVGYYPNSGYYPSSGYYPNTGFGAGNGGYGGFGGNGGLTTYYGYGRDDYYGDRNMGFGYQQGTNQIGFSRVGDQNLAYNSYPSYSSSSSSSSSYY